MENTCHSFVCPGFEVIFWKMLHSGSLFKSPVGLRGVSLASVVSYRSKVSESELSDTEAGRVRNWSGWEQPGLFSGARSDGVCCRSSVGRGHDTCGDIQMAGAMRFSPCDPVVWLRLWFWLLWASLVSTCFPGLSLRFPIVSVGSPTGSLIQ